MEYILQKGIEKGPRKEKGSVTPAEAKAIVVEYDVPYASRKPVWSGCFLKSPK